MSGRSEDTTTAELDAKTLKRIPALDGLRGLAVLAVVLYHFTPELVPAGFLGVDVFLVLSGFLITSLALEEVDRTKSMSASGFFARRARRLLPASIATIVVVVIVARILDHGSVDSSLRGHAVAALTYIANWWSIAQQNSYQAAFGTESPLNHFWSLAVEEQFYLVFPIALIGTVALLRRRIGVHRLAHVALIGAVVGAIASCALMWILRTPGSDPSRVYLGTDTRSQALFVGIAIACIVRLRPVKSLRAVTRATLTAAALVALAALVGIASTADFRSDWLYTGGFLFIAIATGIVVLALNGHDSFFTKALSFRWLRTLGLVSYGLYLWHWPIKVFVTGERLHLSDDQTGRIELFVIRVALTAVATALSWYLIEQPFRRRKPASTEATATKRPSRIYGGLGAIGATALVLGIVWFGAAPSAPAPTDFSSNVAPSTGAAKNADPPISLLWFGDSVAWTIGGGIVEFPWPTGYDSPFDPTRIVIWNKGISECSFMQQQTKSFGILRSGGGSCVGWETNWRDASASFSPDAIVWSGALRDTYDVLVNGTWVAFGSPEWIALYNAELDKAAAIATENGIPLVIVSQADPKVLPDEKREDSLTASNIGKFTQLRQIQREYALVNSDTTVSIDLNELLCAGGPCEELTPSGKTIRIDHLHYSTAGAAHIAPTVTTAIESAFKQWHAQHRN
jgi:peptidoglycan/LPS O-acetylase OafA/YrhL